MMKKGTLKLGCSLGGDFVVFGHELWVKSRDAWTNAFFSGGSSDLIH